MNLTNLKLSQLKPYENNPRVNDHAVPAVMESIKKFGYQQPIVVDKDYIVIVGHTRLKALIELFGQDKEFPVIVAKDLTQKQIDAYRLADNKVGELADWSIPELAYEITQLIEDYDFSKLGWSRKELALLTGEEEILPEESKEKFSISIGKEKINLIEEDFKKWEQNFSEHNGKPLVEYLLEDLGLFNLKRRYELMSSR
jgi:ParB-like chromosome segregation protein Spo0J